MSEQLPDRAGVLSQRAIPAATVARLPGYLRVLGEFANGKQSRISSSQLAIAAGVNPAKLRKDLSHLGSYGVRGVGYTVEHLTDQISRALGLNRDWPVVVVGVGHLGRALVGYDGFAARGFRIAALVDANPSIVGQRVSGLPVHDMAQLSALVSADRVKIGIIATPAMAAQDVCDQLVSAGVTSILNFAPCVLTAASGIEVRKVDVAMELQILSFHEHRRDTEHRRDPVGMLAAGAEVGDVRAGLDERAEVGS